MARRGRRSLSPEELNLWKQVAASTVPLRHVPVEDAPRAEAPPVTRAAPLPEPAPPAEPPVRRHSPPADPHAALGRANPHMDRRRFDALRKGKMEPEARLDLHGMTAEQAHASLTGFILTAHSAGLKVVLVITGKGRAPEDGWHAHRHGVLRQNVPHWLASAQLSARVLQVTTAHRKHGGAGAFYVYLRRRR